MSAFIDKVAEMREAQKNYFRLRTGLWLSKSKALEREVDRMIAEAKDPQQSLFGGEA